MTVVSEVLSQSGHECLTWDGSAARLGQTECLTCPPAIAEVISGAEIVISVAADDQAVHDLVMRRGLLDRLAPDAVHVCATHISVAAARHLTEMHAAKRQRFIAAPIVQTPHTVLRVAAGDAGTVHHVQPILQAIGPCSVVGSIPWHAALVATGCLRLSELGSDVAREEVYASIRAAGIPLEAFMRAMRPEAGGVDEPPATLNLGVTPPDCSLQSFNADLADPT